MCIHVCTRMWYVCVGTYATVKGQLCRVSVFLLPLYEFQVSNPSLGQQVSFLSEPLWRFLVLLEVYLLTTPPHRWPHTLVVGVIPLTEMISCLLWSPGNHVVFPYPCKFWGENKWTSDLPRNSDCNEIPLSPCCLRILHPSLLGLNVRSAKMVATWETFACLDNYKLDPAYNGLQRSQVVVFSLPALLQPQNPGLVHSPYEMWIWKTCSAIFLKKKFLGLNLLPKTILFPYTIVASTVIKKPTH